MAKYNPYLLQTLNELSKASREGFESFLGFMGYAALVLTGRGPPSPGECGALVEHLSRIDKLQRSDALALAWLAGRVAGLQRLLKSGGLLNLVECSEAMKGNVGNAVKLLVKLVNDLRRTYVVEIIGDEEACREWRGGEARLTGLAGAAASSTDNPVIAGALIYTVGLALRVTPAYHLLAIAIGVLAASGREACRASIEEVVDVLANSPRILRAANRIYPSQQGNSSEEKHARLLASLLARETLLMCSAIEVLRSNEDVLARSLLKVGMAAEILDPSLLLDPGVLAVPPKRLDREVEACLERCAR